MRKLFLSLFATVFASTIALAAEGASPASPPVAEGAVPSAYVWFSGGSIAVGERITLEEAEPLAS